MAKVRIAFPRRHLLTALLILSVSMVAFWAYKDTLQTPFTAVDTLPLIHTSRIESVDDLTRILTQRMLAGTGFPLHYYRPITSLSFSLDYLFWKLDPFGYHLTDLVLHILVTVLVFSLALALTKGRRLTAWLGAVLFSAHPVLVESVPASARRQGTIAALFLLLAMLCFIGYEHRLPLSKLLFPMSLLCYGLALGAKEMAVILPVLAFAYVATRRLSERNSPTSLKARIKRSMPLLAAYVGVTLAFVLWRTVVLKGLGGQTDSPPMEPGLVLSITNEYFTALLDPYGLIGPERLGYAIILVCTLALLLLAARVCQAVRGHAGPRVQEAVRSLLSMTALLLLLGVVNHLSRRALPDELGWEALLAPFCLLVCLVGIRRSRIIGGIVGRPESGETATFLLLWLLLPLAVYVLNSVSNVYRTIYIAVIPFSLLLALVLSESLEAVIPEVKRWSSSQLSSRRFSFRITATISLLAVAVALSASLLAHSPLMHAYGEWEASGIISSRFLARLSETASQLPEGSSIHVYGLPWKIGHYARQTPHARRVSYLRDYSVKAWLDITLPDNQMEVEVHTLSSPEILPSDLELDVEVEGQSATVRVRYTLPQSASNIDEHLSLGIAYAESGQYQEAIDHLQTYVAAEPEDYWALSWLGQALYLHGDYDHAEQILLSSLALDSEDNGKAYSVLSQLYSSQQRYHDTEGVCLQWHREMPGEAHRAQRCLGWASYFLGEYEQAVVRFRASISSQPTPDAYKGLVRSHWDGTGDLAEALQYALEWLACDDTSAEAAYFVGRLYHERGEHVRAARALERALDLGGLTQQQQDMALSALGSSYVAVDDLPAALQSTLRWVESSPQSPQAHSRVAEVYVLLENCEEARRWLAVSVGLGLGKSRSEELEAATELCGEAGDLVP